MIALTQLLSQNNICLDQDLGSTEELFEFVDQLFAKQLAFPPHSIKNCLNDREALGSTGLGQGIAIPHGRVHNLKEPHLGFVRLQKGIEFNSPFF